MASNSLGTLTLDLAVRLSEFTDGLTQAERETRNSTDNMSGSVRTFRESVEDSMGKAKFALGAMAVGAAASVTALVSMTLESAKADAQLSIMANTANTSLKSFQVLSYAAAGLGVEQDALAGILGDVQEKLGEFSATGGGGAADFFEALQNNTKMTDEEISNLGKTLQGKDGAEAIQLVKDKMDALGATSQEQRFVFESLAGDLGNLMPLFADGGDILSKYGEELEAAGVIKTEAAIEQSRRLTAQTQAVTTQFDGFKTQLAVQMMPVLNSLMGYFVDGKVKGGQFGSVMDSVGLIAKTVGAGIIGVVGGIKLLVRMVQAFGEQVANVGITTSNFFEADGFVAKARALKQGLGDYYDINARLGQDFVREFAAIRTAMTGMYAPINAELTGLAAANYALSDANSEYAAGLGVSTKDADAAAAAEAKLAGAKDKTSKAISNQMMVYKAWRSAGLSDNQARIITAEVGRENDYQSKYLFGGHSDPKNNKYNLGMISWQKERGKELNDYLKNLGLIQNGQIVKTQEALNAQAMFALREITTNPRFDRTKKEFLSNPDIGYDEGAEVLGNNYIAWAYKNEKYASGHDRRDQHYNKLNFELGNTDIIKGLQAENKAVEDLLKRQGSIQAKYANEREKLDRDYVADVTEIESLYAEGSDKRTELLARAKTAYDLKRTATAKSILESYMKDEERLTYEHNQKIEKINIEFAHDDTTRQMLVDLQNDYYKKDLENFRFAAGAKDREQKKLYQSISDNAKANGINSLSTGLDSIAQSTMSANDYSVWRLGQDYQENTKSVNDQYTNRQNEINVKDERGKEILPEIERNKLLEIAKQEHLDNMWAMEQDYALKEQTLSAQLQNAKLDNYANTMGAMGSLLGAFAGENNRISQMMFSAQKGYALAQIFMNNKVALSEAWASAPFPYNVPAVTMAALETGALAAAAQAITPMFSGIAHGGLDYVPKEQTYLLDKGERVLSPNQNKDFTNFMQGNKGGNSYSGDGVGEVNIVVTVDAKGNSSMTGDTANNLGRVMAKEVEQTARNVVRKELMQGGMIDKRLRR